jgi:hypothetical protein
MGRLLLLLQRHGRQQLLLLLLHVISALFCIFCSNAEQLSCF